ncbi:ATP-binding protein [Leptothoe kymatousa]|uniref:histidine kinase n=1 Tax=Leptothoe kymatousa TAU-MAC 1615 TaxID=2364775 RepID=A0ABS5Y3M9_9CYAN|nr:ATP-binding protein [Leptothoe kymatousa]MBT9312439.1 response regulator [Leptothoe kymatousa TAU-MAC 1615]
MQNLRKFLALQFQNSVALRYLTIASSFVLSVQLVFSLLQIHRSQTQQMNNLHDRVKTKAAFLRGVAPEAIFDLDFLYLETMMQQATEDSDIVYSVIISHDGELLTKYLNRDQLVVKSVIAAPDTQPENLLDVLAKVDQQPYMHQVLLPIEPFGEPLGQIRLGYSTQRVRSESVIAALNSIIRAFLVSLLLAALTIVLFNRQVYMPLKALRKFARGFEEGNLSQRIQIGYGDEIGQVGSALNRMADQLQENLVGLAKARDEAIAANKAKSEFLANMSHELRTPLNAILGFSELMTREQDTTPNQKRTLETINRSGEHLLALINDVLEMAKIESGQTLIEPVAFDLPYFLQTLYDMLRVRAQAQNLHLVFNYRSDLPQYVKADERKLRQVLLNLLSNAVKFTQAGCITLQVETFVDPSQPQIQRVSFAVEDTGPGIANENLAAIFEPFEQTDLGRNSQKGTGLGLAISRRYVRLMGGDLTVSSQVGQGSTFQFALPIQLAAAVDVKLETHETKRIIGLAPEQNTYRLLIVEDVEENRQLLTRILELTGFEVKTAANGLEGLECWKAWHPHLVWMDMRMPVMDGFEATRCIRDLEKNQIKKEQQSTIIIALTAFAFEEHRTMALEAGCDDYVRKPFREQDLFEKLEQHLDVRYLYEGEQIEPTEASTKSVEKGVITHETMETQIAAMPRDWLEQLHAASIELDREAVSNLLQQVVDEHSDLAAQLQTWANSFRFDKITDYTSDILEGAHI